MRIQKFVVECKNSYELDWRRITSADSWEEAVRLKARFASDGHSIEANMRWRVTTEEVSDYDMQEASMPVREAAS